ncbi:hypothetical protein PN441_13780 [Spirulina major CS-329]|nr:hypothetical protein [Spirulina subsalsa CS-330]MDB9504142.1 hypothetical protein [Spirulina major CS-329]
MSLSDQVAEFQATMDRITDMVEESRALAGQIPELSISESPAKVRIIFEMCEDSVSELKKAINQAEGIQQTLGRF